MTFWLRISRRSRIGLHWTPEGRRGSPEQQAPHPVPVYP